MGFLSGSGPFVGPTQDELIEVRERTDAGLRLAFPRLFDRTVEEPTSVPPPLEDEVAKRVSSKLLDAQAAIRAAALEVPLDGEQALHKQFNALVNQIDDIGAVLAERFGS